MDFTPVRPKRRYLTSLDRSKSLPHPPFSRSDMVFVVSHSQLNAAASELPGYSDVASLKDIPGDSQASQMVNVPWYKTTNFSTGQSIQCTATRWPENSSESDLSSMKYNSPKSNKNNNEKCLEYDTLKEHNKNENEDNEEYIQEDQYEENLDLEQNYISNSILINEDIRVLIRCPSFEEIAEDVHNANRTEKSKSKATQIIKNYNQNENSTVAQGTFYQTFTMNEVIAGPSTIDEEKVSLSSTPSLDDCSYDYEDGIVFFDHFRPGCLSERQQSYRYNRFAQARKRTKTEPRYSSARLYDDWKWWGDVRTEAGGEKWHFLEHKGPLFAPPYERLPCDVKFFYNNKPVRLSKAAEEIATFYARMLDTAYVRKNTFNKNFFNDWRKVMTCTERELITDLRECNFTHICEYFTNKSQDRKTMSREGKRKLKDENERIREEYGYCIIDGRRERIRNFRVEPPGLFRGRGEHPKMGMVKRRVMPEDVIINCSQDSIIPRPPEGHQWKEVRHDKSVLWLASWIDKVLDGTKYVLLNNSARIKAESEQIKFEKARKLGRCIHQIRKQYRKDWTSSDMKTRQRAVALYFIDRLALRAGFDKVDDSAADTVGCCSLRVEHISLRKENRGRDCIVMLDFLGKDCIRYHNAITVHKKVYENLRLFKKNKPKGSLLFHRLTPSSLNTYLRSLMKGLTAKVFRTYNASITLERELRSRTKANSSIYEKLRAYNRANRAVAILCNHQKTVPKTFANSLKALKRRISAKEKQVRCAAEKLREAKRKYQQERTARAKIMMFKKRRALERLKDQLERLKSLLTDKIENRDIALTTSKVNYIDPRITIAWCKKYDVPIEKVYTKSQRERFEWAMSKAGPNFKF